MINTTVEQMETDATNVEKNKVIIEETLSKLKACVESVDDTVWAGESSATFKQRFSDFHAEIIKSVNACEVFKEALSKAAVVYKEHEAAINTGANQI